jgi:pyruvate decarboxylase
VQYANYPTTDIRHILPLLLPAFKKVDCSSQGKAIKQDLEEKTRAGHVDKLYTAPKEGGGKEIKHDWLWSRMGGWFQDTGKSLPIHF